jgi:hypothetical protein
MARTALVQAALALFLLAPLTAEAAKIPPKKRHSHRHLHKTHARAIPPNPDQPDLFFKKMIDSKNFLVVDGLDYPVPRNVNRRPDTAVTQQAQGREVYTATDPAQ